MALYMSVLTDRWTERTLVVGCCRFCWTGGCIKQVARPCQREWHTFLAGLCLTCLCNAQHNRQCTCLVCSTCFLSTELAIVTPSVLWCCWLGSRKSIRCVKNWVVRYWHGYLSGARCKWFAYGPADATAAPSSLAPVKSRMVYLSGAGLPRLS